MANYTSKFTGAEIDAALTKAQACKTVTAATINASGHLVLTFSDGATLDAGTAKGDKGDTGATGAAGDDGYTPVKGTDYFTDADKAELVSSVLSSLPAWTGGEY